MTDPSARYFGAPLSEDTLTPDEGAIIGVGTFDDWLRQSSTGAGGHSTSATHPSRRELLQEILRGGGKDVATTEHTV